MLEFFGGRAQADGSEVGRAAFDTVCGASESRNVASSQAVLQLRDALGGVLQENGRDLAEKFVVVARVERAKIFDRLRIDDGSVEHGTAGWSWKIAKDVAVTDATWPTRTRWSARFPRWW